jgi:hypothetical protein
MHKIYLLKKDSRVVWVHSYVAHNFLFKKYGLENYSQTISIGVQDNLTKWSWGQVVFIFQFFVFKTLAIFFRIYTISKNFFFFFIFI